MDSTWWLAGGLVLGGLLLGSVTAVVARRLLERPSRRQAVRQAARPAASLLFWVFLSAGLIAAVASSSPDTLRPIPSDVLAWLPRAAVAGLILIAGFVLAGAVSAAIGRVANRASGRRQPMLESASRTIVISAAGVLALTQLGVDTTILNILIAAVAFGVAAALAGIAVLGGRDIAAAVAAGRSVVEHLDVGDRVTIGGFTGVVERLTATHAVLNLDNGDRAVVVLSAVTDEALVVHRG